MSKDYICLFEIQSYLEDMELDKNLLEWRTLSLPESRHRRKKEVCLERLKEIYERVLEAEEQNEENLKVNQFLIVHHDLNELDIEWNDKLKQLFEVYLEDFSQTIVQQFKPVKVVVFSIEYYDKDDPFFEFFKELEGKFPERIFNLTEMSPVKKRHIGNWRRKVFKKRLSVPSVSEIFPFDQPISMFDAIDHLLLEIEKYNQKMS